MTATATTAATGTARELHLRAGSTSDGTYDVVVTPESAGWGYSSFRVLRLLPGGRHEFATGDEELVIVPLSGSCVVVCDGAELHLRGRADVFSGVSDLAYVPRDAQVVVSSGQGGRFALSGARCERRLPVRYRAATDVPVEIRGAGSCSRQVNAFAAADSFETDKLIAVEVLTPAGNWSSYPPHKHDEHRPGEESELEEVYYYEVSGDGGVGYQRVYGTAERPIDVLAEVRDGDVVLVPHGYHGPSMAAPGYDLYYLNVMAGPAPDRDWAIVDDPDHAWVRGTWTDEPVDPRLPMTSAPAPSSGEAAR